MFAQLESLFRDNQGDTVRRMRRVRADPVCFEHLLGISVVGGDEANAPLIVDRRNVE